jgi:mannose-6-phosphate isomerase-like protein (cupin superfamily)
MSEKPFVVNNIIKQGAENTITDTHIKILDSPLVVMSITDRLKNEIHQDKTQVTYIISGFGKVSFDKNKTFQVVTNDSVIVIPKGVPHEITNLDKSRNPLKLFSIYIL